MPKQRMAGYVPLKGAPAETEPAPAPAQDTTTAAPASAAAAVPVAPTAPTSGLTPLSARRRMAGYVPFAREAEWLGGAPAPAAGSIPAAAPARSVAPEPIAASASPTRAPAPAETEPVVPDVAAVVASATGAPAAAGVGAPVESDLVPLAKRRRMAGYVPFAREGEWFTELAAVGGPTAPEMVAQEVDAPEQATAEPTAEPAAAAPARPVVAELADVEPADAEPAVAAPVAAASAPEPAPTAPDTRSAPPASAVQPPRAATGTPARTAETDAAESAVPSRLRKALPAVAGVVVLALLAVLAARWLRSLDPVADFIATYDGHPVLPEGTPEGMPWWMGWQHFLNMFLMVLIIRTGLQIRHETRPPANFTPTKDGLFSARGNTPKKFSLTIWTHQALDALWLLNGVIFVVLLIVTGHWARIVPTDPHVFQHALSAGIQYLSLDWPTENGWVHYNALQMLSYALVVFVAAPLAALTGWRMSSWFPTEAKGLNKAFPMEVARKVHFPVMVFFVAFIVVHVFLVAFTGLLTNLNHMYTSRGGATDAWGLVVFLVSVAVTAAAWFFLKPAFTAPVASRFGTVGR
ncbi:cytochrome b/b6 domain-containing protein [Micrococcus luteus]|uniref:cytochrome b/b6 domain-containing protein n=1 Tax=Micrococcus TaxID=1269 RepID=UPI000596D066|nr:MULTISPECIES: cytochrome b/b6 domain-containing protein [Micrococcus]KIK89153.1 thiosulfate reductase [Micrococcus luteus]MCT1815728.1 cytochrome b/b6 domain-containing protein [Micrococcus luteus]MCV7642741.1 cytochrome b/b6 domain-containing protein [Micrococcus luteus]MCV7687113.1 cytochrome b/b6 domain-containing protein [Micrococcus luteus]MDK7176659.1 cytochrome b/b6 domain-containing protein [Micrococcus luteus]